MKKQALLLFPLLLGVVSCVSQGNDVDDDLLKPTTSYRLELSTENPLLGDVLYIKLLNERTNLYIDDFDVVMTKGENLAYCSSYINDELEYDYRVYYIDFGKIGNIEFEVKRSRWTIKREFDIKEKTDWTPIEKAKIYDIFQQDIPFFGYSFYVDFYSGDPSAFHTIIDNNQDGFATIYNNYISELNRTSGILLFYSHTSPWSFYDTYTSVYRKSLPNGAYAELSVTFSDNASGPLRDSLTISMHNGQTYDASNGSWPQVVQAKMIDCVNEVTPYYNMGTVEVLYNPDYTASRRLTICSYSTSVIDTMSLGGFVVAMQEFNFWQVSYSVSSDPSFIFGATCRKTLSSNLGIEVYLSAYKRSDNSKYAYMEIDYVNL